MRFQRRIAWRSYTKGLAAATAHLASLRRRTAALRIAAEHTDPNTSTGRALRGALERMNG